MRKIKKHSISLILSTALLFSILSSTGPVAAEQRHDKPFIGFTGVYALNNDSSPVTIIVMFSHKPAGVQVYEAKNKGKNLPMTLAENIVKDDHDLFRAELAELFGANGKGHGQSYTINWEYRRALNGVSVTLPSDMVKHVAQFNSVRAGFPNARLWLDTIDAEYRSSYGMSPGRQTMQADDMHLLGYQGTGVTVAVLDTGIDYNHPAFNGAFLTLDEMRLKNAGITEMDTINGLFYGRNFYHDAPANDPMETTPDMGGAATEHGTHVAGTILGRDTGDEKSILGIAPDAKMFAYRVLGPGGQGSWDDILAGMEQTTYDKPDIVNMSLGTGDNSPVCLLSLAINNIMLAYEDITFVVAAGNSGPGKYTVGSPATASNAIAVASADKIDEEENRLRIQLSRFSSQGPVSQSFEIKPDVTAHGSYIFSAVPPWSQYVEEGSPDNTYSKAYAYKKGTSMAAPHVSGAAALLIEYSRRNIGRAWDAKTLKTRLMNTAIPLDGSVYNTGAGYVDVYSAAHTDTVVYTTYNKVPTQSGVLYDHQDYVETNTGSFSFGGHFTTPKTTVPKKTMSAHIENHSDAERTYTLDYRFVMNPGSAASLSFSESNISVNPGSENAFTASISVKAGSHNGFYEGYIFVRDKESGGLVAALPFAFVTERLNPPVVSKIMLPVGTTGVFYKAQLYGICNAPSLTNWFIESGRLPPGLVLQQRDEWGVDESGVLHSACAVIRGTPTESGSFTFTVRAENEAGYDNRELSIVIR